jgi:hypothetical protein
MTFKESEELADQNLTDILYSKPQNEKAFKGIIKQIYQEE